MRALAAQIMHWAIFRLSLLYFSQG